MVVQASIAPFENGILLATFVVGLLTAAVGTLNRAGYLRGAFIWHDVTSMPGHMRYTPYGSIPAGLAISTAAVAGEFGLRDRTVETAVLMGCVFLLFGVAAWLMWKRPDWVKPQWIRQREADQRPSKTHFEVPRRLYQVLWASWLTMLAASFFVERAFMMAAPLGFGLVILLALKPAQPGKTR